MSGCAAIRVFLFHLVIVALLAGLSSPGFGAESNDVVVGIEGASLWQPALRMVLSLAAVLAVLAACAWFATKLRNGSRFKTGLIEIVSGISLGGREKVVLLKVANEKVLVGISPAGMRALHVLQNRSASREFDDCMEQAQ